MRTSKEFRGHYKNHKVYFDKRDLAHDADTAAEALALLRIIKADIDKGWDAARNKGIIDALLEREDK